MSELIVSYKIQSPQVERRHKALRALAVFGVMNIPSPIGAIVYWWVIAR